MSSFIPKYFLQNLKNVLVAKRTIDGGTLGRPVDSWVAFGNRATIFQQHCQCISLDYTAYMNIDVWKSLLNLMNY